MSNSVCFTISASCKPLFSQGIIGGSSSNRKVEWISDVSHSFKNVNFQSLEVKATSNTNSRTKPNSIVCANCDGNGAVACSQCQGSGVNSVDHFNGQFKAGGLCWLCRGKKEMLCGECNGAGFLGGMMSTFDE